MLYLRFLQASYALPLLFLVSSAVVKAAPISVEAVIAELQPRTDLPIWIPDEISEMDEVYVSYYTAPDLYSIYFDYIPDCGGSTACNYGSFTADRNGTFFTPDDLLNPVARGDIPPDEIVPIRFDNGMSGQFANFCGAYCTAQVQWRLGGILYAVTIKNGTRAATLELANNILQGEVRTQGTAR